MNEDPPKATERGAPKRRRGRNRGDAILDPRLERLVQGVGREKIVPDITTEERNYARSLRFRRKIMEYLVLNDGTTWATLSELADRAANYAQCSSVTSARWIRQYTAVEAPFRLIDSIDYLTLVRRE